MKICEEKIGNTKLNNYKTRIVTFNKANQTVEQTDITHFVEPKLNKQNINIPKT